MSYVCTTKTGSDLFEPSVSEKNPKLMQSVILLKLFEKFSLWESLLNPKENFYRFQNTLKNISRQFVKAFHLIKTNLEDRLRT